MSWTINIAMSIWMFAIYWHDRRWIKGWDKAFVLFFGWLNLIWGLVVAVGRYS